MAMDLQSRAPKHGARRHHTQAEIDARRLTPLPGAAKNGGLPYQPTPRGLEAKIAEKLAHLRTLDEEAEIRKKEL